ncbi:MAG: glycosyltransferase family 2 protein [Proteobacteria bacterium]|nr:glycosyltransferase family 2 protein [Pseudomonadota bacterium]
MADKTRGKDQLISVVFSFRNEEAVLDELIDCVSAAIDGAGHPYEIIFVNDASDDGSLDILGRRAKADARIKIITMSNRFGVSECALAGMERAKGAAVVYMDTDLQDPPEVLPELFEKWRGGADLVYTRRLSRSGESPFRMWATKYAYAIINAVSEIELPVEAGDLRLLDRKVVEALLALPESNPYLRGLTMWVGFERAEVWYHRQARAGGETHFPGVFSKGPVNAFVAGITSFSMWPLYAVLLAGLAGLGVGAGGLMLSGLAALAGFGCATAGWVFFLLLLWGGLMTGVGIVAMYMSRMYRDIRGRPRHIVKDTVNLD